MASKGYAMKGLLQAGQGLGDFLKDFAKYSGAGSAANGVSAQAQRNQGAFNQNSVNMANDIGTRRLMEQFQFNAAQAAAANDWTQRFWQMQADYNSEEAEKSRMFSEYMWNKEAAFNAQQAELGRQWQTEMMSTQYQRAMADMEQAGLNPILAYGGISGGVGSPPTASVSGAQSAQASASMGSGAMGSGSVLNGLSASEGNYTGQMEYYAGLMSMIASLMSNQSSAMAIAGKLGEFGKGFMESIQDLTQHPFKYLYETASSSAKSSAKLIKDFFNKKK